MSSVLALLAVLPAAILLFVIYKADNIEKEPISLMAKVFVCGALTCVSAYILETIGSLILSFFFREANGLYTFLMMFCVVAASEEAGKFVALKLTTWKNPEFNFSFDGIVYSVCATLGFATLENIMYVYQYGLSTAITRCITAVPGHCIFGIFMGIYYGMAKACELRGNEAGKKLNLRKAFLIPVLLHGAYDFFCSLDYDGMLLLFIALEIGMTVHAIKMVKKMSKTDMPLAPNMQMAPNAQAMPGTQNYINPNQGMMNQNQYMNQTPVMNQNQFVNQTPVMNQNQFVNQTPVMNQNQFVNQTPVMNQNQFVNQTPVMNQNQFVNQTPVMNQNQFANQSPVQPQQFSQTVAPATETVQQTTANTAQNDTVYNPNPVFSAESIDTGFGQ